MHHTRPILLSGEIFWPCVGVSVLLQEGFFSSSFSLSTVFAAWRGRNCLVVEETNTPSWLQSTYHTRPILLSGEISWPCVGVSVLLQEGFSLKSPPKLLTEDKKRCHLKSVSNHWISSQRFYSAIIIVNKNRSRIFTLGKNYDLGQNDVTTNRLCQHQLKNIIKYKPPPLGNNLARIVHLAAVIFAIIFRNFPPNFWWKASQLCFWNPPHFLPCLAFDRNYKMLPLFYVCAKCKEKVFCGPKEHVLISP